MNTREDVAEGVKEVVAEVLSLDPEEVREDARFEQDLGGESIDFLELTFRCEKCFGVRLDFQRLFAQNEVVTDDRGVLTRSSVELLSQRLPFLDFAGLGPDPTPERIRELITIRAITGMVTQALAAAASEKASPGIAPA